MYSADLYELSAKIWDKATHSALSVYTRYIADVSRISCVYNILSRYLINVIRIYMAVRVISYGLKVIDRDLLKTGHLRPLTDWCMWLLLY